MKKINIYVITEIAEGSLCGTHVIRSKRGAEKVMNKILSEYEWDGEPPTMDMSGWQGEDRFDMELPGDEMNQSKLHFEMHTLTIR